VVTVIEVIRIRGLIGVSKTGLVEALVAVSRIAVKVVRS